MSTIEFPPIDAAPQAVAIKAPAVPATLKATVVAQFEAIRPEIVALAARYDKVAFDVATPKGLAAAKAARLELRESGRFMLQRTEKRLRNDANELKAVVTDEVAALIGVLEPVEEAIDQQIKAEEERRAAAKAEAERIERDRIEKHQEGITKIHRYLTRCNEPGMTSERVAAGIAALMDMTFPAEEWEEFAVPAASAQCETIEAMRVLQAQLLGREQEAARLELQRQEQARVQAELDAERARIAAELAEVRRQAAELAAQRAESERLEKLAAENRERLAREAEAQARHIQDLQAEPAIGNPPFSANEDADADPDAATRAQPEPPPETVDRDDALTAMEQPAAPVPLSQQPAATMTVKQINARLGPLVQTDSLALQNAGFKKQERPGAGIHFLASDWDLIRAAIVKHVQGLA